MSSAGNPAMQAIKRYEKRFDDIGEGIQAHMAAEAAGEAPDPGSFLAFLERQAVTRRAMEAQVKLHLKPLGLVLAEVK